MKQQMSSLFYYFIWYCSNSKDCQLLGNPKIFEHSILCQESPLIIHQQQLGRTGKVIEKTKQSSFDMSENLAPLLVNKTSQGRSIINQRRTRTNITCLILNPTYGCILAHYKISQNTVICKKKINHFYYYLTGYCVKRSIKT